MPHLPFKRSNKSQASLDKISDTRDHSPSRDQQSYDNGYPQSIHAETEYVPHQNHHQQLQPDERYYDETPVQSGRHLLIRNTNNRNSVLNVYQEQQHSSRPSIGVVPPPQQDSIPEDELYTPGGSQPGPSPSGRDKDRKQKRSFFGLGGPKDKREDREDKGRLSRGGSVLQKKSGPPPQLQHPGSAQSRSPASPNPSQSESIVTYLDQRESREAPDVDRYYHDQRQPQYQAEHQDPSSQDRQYRQLQQIYQQEQEYKPSFPRGDHRFEADPSLRPPSQSSLGPPSPVGGGRLTLSSQSTSQTPRYSVQEQIYRQQPPSQTQSPTQQLQPQSIEIESVQSDMRQANRDRSTREPRMEDEQRYAPQDVARVRMSAQQETGRNTPPPLKGREDAANLPHEALLAKYEELSTKYSKVKRYYFEKEAQVTQLQNTVANQRLSMSKTSLDDNQYMTRFERLNGAIQNLAFNVRKDWRRIPNWLVPACNRDACAVGTKEMTAVGRAVISKWLFDRVFQEIFHPGIDPVLSSQLKQMERALRRAPGSLTEEQRDDLLTKVTTWRLTTCESLHDFLQSRDSEANSEHMAKYLTDQLCDYLCHLLNSPPPPGLEGHLYTIITQTLSIAANLPLESRDIGIEYFLPGTPINETYMKLESGMTTLVNPGSAPSRDDHDEDQQVSSQQHQHQHRSDSVASTAADQTLPNSVEEQIREATRAAQVGRQDSVTGDSSNSHFSSPSLTSTKDKKKSSSMFSSFGGGFANKKSPPAQTQHQPSNHVNDSSGGSSTRGPSTHDLTTSQPDGSAARRDVPGDMHGQMVRQDSPDDESQYMWNIDVMTRGQREGKIRFAVFLAVEVRGKSAAKNESTQAQSQSGSNSSSNNNNSSSGGGGNGNDTSQAQKDTVQQPLNSAGLPLTPGQQLSGNSAGAAGAAPTGANILVKAPVFAF